MRSNKSDCESAVNDALKKLATTEESLIKAREEIKTTNEDWQKKYGKLTKDLVDQDEAIEEGVTQTCNISQTFQTRWQSAPGWNWILEGFTRLIKRG